jgi:arginase family enzyme
MDGIVKKIRDRIGTQNPVYISIDIDTLDPACKTPTSPLIYFIRQEKHAEKG